MFKDVHYGTFGSFGIFRNLYFESRTSNSTYEYYQHIDFSFMNILCLKLNNTSKAKHKNTSTTISYCNAAY